MKEKKQEKINIFVNGIPLFAKNEKTKDLKKVRSEIFIMLHSVYDFKFWSLDALQKLHKELVTFLMEYTEQCCKISKGTKLAKYTKEYKKLKKSLEFMNSKNRYFMDREFLVKKIFEQVLKGDNLQELHGFFYKFE